MRQLWLVGILALAVAACGQAGSNQTDPPVYYASPSPSPTARPTSVTMTGKVYVAANQEVDATTKLPVKYQPAPAGAQVSIRAKGTSRWKSVATKDGAYTFEVMANTPLEVMASCSGFSSRVQDFTPTLTAQTLDFESKNKAYLVDCPEVVSVTPSLAQKLDPSRSMSFVIKFSEPLDASSFDAEAIALTSTDIASLSITQGTRFMDKTATVVLSGDTVTLTTNAPLANLKVNGNNYPQVFLSYGQGTLKERADGAKLNAGTPQAVSGYNLDGKKAIASAAIPLRFWTDDVAPVLRSASSQGGVLTLTFSEPMTAMINSQSATGSYDPGVLLPENYQVVASVSADANPPVVTISQLQFDQSDPAVVRGTLEIDGSATALTIIPRNIMDPAGNAMNAASSSVVIRFI